MNRPVIKPKITKPVSLGTHSDDGEPARHLERQPLRPEEGRRLPVPIKVTGTKKDYFFAKSIDPVYIWYV